MKAIGWLVLLGLSASACNRIIDSQPAPVDSEETVPASAIRPVISRYPQATDLVFTALEKNQVWRVTFQQQATRYQAVTNQQLLLVAYQLTPAVSPDSLRATLKNTLIDGGTLSNIRRQDYSWYRDVEPINNGSVLLADYVWRGNTYTVRWTSADVFGQMTYRTELVSPTQLDYYTVTLADLPLPIQQSLADQQIGFTRARVQTDGQGQKLYTLTVPQPNKTYTLTYNTAGQLLAAVTTNATQQFTSVSQLPSSIQAYLTRTPELAGFGPEGTMALLARNDYRGLQTYTVNLQNGQQAWLMTFNGQGQLINRSYVNTI
jgi:YD repeat-containing protein